MWWDFKLNLTKSFFKISKHIIPWNFGHFQNLKIDGFRIRTLLGRLNEWVERVRIGNLFMVFISRENDSFPRYPVRKLADPKVEINRNLVFEGFNWFLDRNTVFMLLWLSHLSDNFSVTLILVTDVGDEMCWWQV